QLRDGLQGPAEAPLAVVEIAVVDVGREAAAPVGGADETTVPARDAPCLPVADRRIPAAGNVTRGELEADRMHARAPAEAHEGCHCRLTGPFRAGPRHGARGDRTATTQRTCSHSPPGEPRLPSLRPAAAGRQGGTRTRRLGMGDLKDAVADLLAQDELRILRHAQQHLIEL